MKKSCIGARASFGGSICKLPVYGLESARNPPSQHRSCDSGSLNMAPRSIAISHASGAQRPPTAAFSSTNSGEVSLGQRAKTPAQHSDLTMKLHVSRHEEMTPIPKSESCRSVWAHVPLRGRTSDSCVAADTTAPTASLPGACCGVKTPCGDGACFLACIL